MTDIPRVTVAVAHTLYTNESAVFIDIRDPGSYERGHIPGAIHVNDNNIEAFIENADKSKPHIMYCYHGNSSQGGTAFLLEQGFENVSSMDGGYAVWSHAYPQ